MKMGISINTKFSINERAYVLSYARDEGQLISGIVDRIMIKIGDDGTPDPIIYYKMTQTIAFVPPGEFWVQYELGTKEEASILAQSYNKKIAEMYARKALNP
jgi:hypothetical protein